jgi:hypothetical protein
MFCVEHVVCESRNSRVFLLTGSLNAGRILPTRCFLERNGSDWTGWRTWRAQAGFYLVTTDVHDTDRRPAPRAGLDRSRRVRCHGFLELSLSVAGNSRTAATFVVVTEQHQRISESGEFLVDDLFDIAMETEGRLFVEVVYVLRSIAIVEHDLGGGFIEQCGVRIR